MMQCSVRNGSHVHHSTCHVTNPPPETASAQQHPFTPGRLLFATQPAMAWCDVLTIALTSNDNEPKDQAENGHFDLDFGLSEVPLASFDKWSGHKLLIDAIL